MKILIKQDAGKLARREVPAHAGFTTNQFSYFASLDKVAGTWLTVETKFCFEDQFNTESLRIMADIVEQIDFEDWTIEGFKQQVQAYYDTAWPGQKANFRKIDRILKLQANAS